MKRFLFLLVAGLVLLASSYVQNKTSHEINFFTSNKNSSLQFTTQGKHLIEIVQLCKVSSNVTDASTNKLITLGREVQIDKIGKSEQVVATAKRNLKANGILV